MSNVIDQLAELGTDVEQAAPADTARRDLLRGRAALRRRRFRRAVTCLGTTAAVAAAVVAVTATQSAPGGAPSATQTAPSAAPSANGFHLVDYTGPKIPGFDISKAPEGFRLRAADFGPDDATPALHGEHKDQNGRITDTIFLTLEGAIGLQPTPADGGTTVQVNGRPATLVHGAHHLTQLHYSDGTHQLVLEADAWVGALTGEDLIAFAESVTMTDDAEAVVAAAQAAHDAQAARDSQKPGFKVGMVPEGLVVQGVSAYALTISRPGDETSADNYVNKLVVMLRSPDVHRVPAGTPVEVNGRPGTIAGATLYFSDGSHNIIVQAPHDLGLTDQELVEFAESVTVTPDAVAPRG